MRLEGKRALITGAMGGIGRKVAERFAAEGAELALADAVSGESPVAGARCYQADLGSVAECRRLAAEVEADLGPIDLLANCVGVFEQMPFDETTEENWDRNVDINLKGVFFLIQAVVPQMRQRGGGRVVQHYVDRCHPGICQRRGLLRGEGRAPQPDARAGDAACAGQNQRQCGGARLHPQRR